MSAFWTNYRSTVLLLAGLLLGGTAGLVFGPGASIVKPVGDIFLNLIFVLVVPLVFFSIALSICNLKKQNLVGKTLVTTIWVFLAMSLIACLLSYVTFRIFDPFEGISQVATASSESSATGTADAIVRAFTVPDFPLLLSKSNLLPLIIFAAIFGLAAAQTSSGKVPVFLEEGMSVIMKMMEIVMKLAPIGLGCYFADMLGRLGGQILGSYLWVFILYMVLALFVYFVMHSIYVVAGGMPLKQYWKHIVTPSLTAIATCSSAACIPVNIKAAKDMGVSGSVAESVIPLGINLHKDGSVMTAVVKVIFALSFFGQFDPSPGLFLEVVGISMLVSIVVGAIPIGGMTGEILVCSLLGLDPSFAATLMVIGTIVDIPATLVNSTANIAGTVIVDSRLKQ